jgi:hypothetical protein
VALALPAALPLFFSSPRSTAVFVYGCVHEYIYRHACNKPPPPPPPPPAACCHPHHAIACTCRQRWKAAYQPHTRGVLRRTPPSFAGRELLGISRTIFTQTVPRFKRFPPLFGANQHTSGGEAPPLDIAPICSDSSRGCSPLHATPHSHLHHSTTLARAKPLANDNARLHVRTCNNPIAAGSRNARAPQMCASAKATYHRLPLLLQRSHGASLSRDRQGH